jgi:hypothetical protein
LGLADENSGPLGRWGCGFGVHLILDRLQKFVAAQGFNEKSIESG